MAPKMPLRVEDRNHRTFFVQLLFFSNEVAVFFPMIFPVLINFCISKLKQAGITKREVPYPVFQELPVFESVF